MGDGEPLSTLRSSGMTTETYDVLIVGGGPAGLAAAAALAESRFSVGHIAQSQPPTWPNSYGLWADDLAGLELVGGDWSSLMERIWDDVAVAMENDGAPRLLGPTYARLDNAATIDALRQRAEVGRVDWLEGWVRTVDIESDRAIVETRSGETHAGRLLVDATGYDSKFVAYTDERAGREAYQAAWGAWIECEGRPVDETSMMLMDFRDDFLGGGESADAVPTFLYAMQMESSEAGSEGATSWFVEETSLAARPPVSFDRLESRLKRRLAHRGVDVVEVRDTERVRIPMGGPMPRLEQPIVGLGGAAAMPHPATGYMVARTWWAAQALGETISDIFSGRRERDDSPMAGRARRAWRAVWPEDAVRARRLYVFGLEMLLSLDAAETRRFFATFFELDEVDWRAYLSGEASPGRLAGVMWRVFRQAPLGMKRRIVGAALSSEAGELWRAWRGDSQRG